MPAEAPQKQADSRYYGRPLTWRRARSSRGQLGRPPRGGSRSSATCTTRHMRRHGKAPTDHGRQEIFRGRGAGNNGVHRLAGLHPRATRQLLKSADSSVNEGRDRSKNRQPTLFVLFPASETCASLPAGQPIHASDAGPSTKQKSNSTHPHETVDYNQGGQKQKKNSHCCARSGSIGSTSGHDGSMCRRCSPLPK